MNDKETFAAAADAYLAAIKSQMTPTEEGFLRSILNDFLQTYATVAQPAPPAKPVIGTTSAGELVTIIRGENGAPVGMIKEQVTVARVNGA